MTDKELHKLKRIELLDLLFFMRKELDELQAENETLRKKLENYSADHEMLEKIFRDVCREEESEKGTAVCEKNR
ncbi:MAG: hypothetical protein K2J08_05355 [Ruminococcus sp.]|nr:hypothetical protein [Ruminococcus sp.]